MMTRLHLDSDARERGRVPASAVAAWPRRLNGATAQLRRAFSLIEMLIALAICAALLTCTLVALNASFMAYQSTTEVASTHTVGRLTMHRIMALVRTGTDFGPFPLDPLETIVESDFIEFITPPTLASPTGQLMMLEWVQNPAAGRPVGEALYVVLFDQATDPPVETGAYLLLEGVKPQFDSDGNRIKPFTLQYAKGRNLYRAMVDLSVKPDDNMSVDLDGQNEELIRLVASAMPRSAMLQQQ